MTALAFAAAKIRVGDIEALEAFYTKALGFTVTARIEEGEGQAHIREIFLGLNGAPAQLALIRYVNLPVPQPGEAIVALMTADLDAAVASVVAHGGTNLTGAIEVPAYKLRLAFVADPEGHQIEIMQQT
jgi:predicted enzyme related to lactoylglutathione lyase